MDTSCGPKAFCDTTLICNVKLGEDIQDSDGNVHHAGDIIQTPPTEASCMAQGASLANAKCPSAIVCAKDKNLQTLESYLKRHPQITGAKASSGSAAEGN